MPARACSYEGVDAGRSAPGERGKRPACPRPVRKDRQPHAARTLRRPAPGPSRIPTSRRSDGRRCVSPRIVGKLCAQAKSCSRRRQSVRASRGLAHRLVTAAARGIEEDMGDIDLLRNAQAVALKEIQLPRLLVGIRQCVELRARSSIDARKQFGRVDLVDLRRQHDDGRSRLCRYRDRAPPGRECDAATCCSTTPRPGRDRCRNPRAQSSGSRVEFSFVIGNRDFNRSGSRKDCPPQSALLASRLPKATRKGVKGTRQRQCGVATKG